MKLVGIMAVLAASLLPALGARADSSNPMPKVGEEFELSKRYESSHRTSDGSSGSSQGREVIFERVIGVREAGLELEYDLRKDATAADRARHWQFPVRVFKPVSGPMQLLNRDELDTRVERWLKTAGLTRADCERLIFTWNAFRIECDPQSVVERVEALSLRAADVREGAPYRDIEALGPGTLARQAAGQGGATFSAVMQINPDAVRRARAESDVAVGEIMQKPVTLDAALRERAKESVSGTIQVTFDTDSAGIVRRRTKVTQSDTKRPDGRSERRTFTETVDRRPVSELSPLRQGDGRPN